MQRVIVLMACAAMCAAPMALASPADVHVTPAADTSGLDTVSTVKIGVEAEAPKAQDTATLFSVCPVPALVSNGSTSGNARSPMPGFLFERSVYLITAAEMAANGWSGAATINGIAWRHATPAGSPATGTLAVYMQNTTDTTYLKGLNYTTAIGTMTNVRSGAATLPEWYPAYPETFNVANFAYTGGGVYVAFDWQWTGPTVPGAVTACSNALAGGLAGAQSNAAAPNTLAASGFRPETYFSTTVGGPTGVANDVSVDLVSSIGVLPNGLVAPHVVKAIVSNRGNNPVINYPVTLSVTGAQTFSDTQNVTLAACSSQTMVTFAGMPITTNGNAVVTVSVAPDDVLTNNSFSRPLTISPNKYSYKYPGTTTATGIGLGVAGPLVAKLITTAPTQVDAISGEFPVVASAGFPYRLAIYADNAGIPGALLYQDAADRAEVTGAFNIRLPAPVAVGTTFYVGIHETTASNPALGYDLESPIRPSSFFLDVGLPAPPASWADFAPNNLFKLNVGATVGSCIVPLTVDVTASSGDVCTGASVLYTCNITGGTGNRTIQWTENGVDISGATGATYNATHASAGAFTYNCKVTDDAGCVDIVDPTPVTTTWVADGGTCSDGNPCTGPDTCNAGVCQPGPNPCDDSNFCTDDACSGGGGCTYTPHNCNDNNACTADSCNVGSGCVNTPVAGACEDGNPCTVGDACSGGVCVPGNIPLPPPIQFCNNNLLSIRDNTTAIPYPATITPSGLVPIVCKTTVNLNNLFHSFPGDIDMLLARSTRNAKIMSDIGTTRVTATLNLVLDDAAANPMPASGGLTSGTYMPTDVNDGADVFPAPAPAALGGAALSIFNGINPNGPWNLFVVDDSGGDTGVLASWCLNITTAACQTPADCDDSSLCTVDGCSNGSCTHVSTNCNDGDVCTDDTCDPSTGLCAHGPANCDDANPCTIDSCTAGVGCVHPVAPASIVTNLKIAANKHSISWDAVPFSPYDIIYGDVQLLHSSGITASTGGCLGDNGANPVSDDVDSPLAGQGFWYLARSRGCGNVTGTYNEGGSQLANRDPLIPAPPVDCSRP